MAAGGAADRWILLKFGTAFDHVTYTTNVQGDRDKGHRICSKNVISQKRRLTDFEVGENYPCSARWPQRLYFWKTVPWTTAASHIDYHVSVITWHSMTCMYFHFCHIHTISKRDKVLAIRTSHFCKRKDWNKSLFDFK